MLFFHAGKDIIIRGAKMMPTKAIILAAIVVLIIGGAFGYAMEDEGCTIGLANEYVTMDGRPLLWKIRDAGEALQQLFYSPGSPYDYVGVRNAGGTVAMGFNEAGIVTGNSYVSGYGPNQNLLMQHYILRNYANLSQIRNYFDAADKPYSTGGRGCFPFIDRDGEAVMFELNGPDWWLEYDTRNSNREGQGLLDFVVRANEFHIQSDGTDDTDITGGRYESGAYNVSGLVDENNLSFRTIIQGNDGPGSGYEFFRYGPGRPLHRMSRITTRSAMVVQGVFPHEDPALTTGWFILGQTNFGIAVPVWSTVSDIPESLATGDMYARALSLYGKDDVESTQASIFPAEAHLFNMVENVLLPHWRSEGPCVEEMTRVQDRMAQDAYSLLYCLDFYRSDNMPPQISFEVFLSDMTADFSLSANDTDGFISDISWDFGDSHTSTEESPRHTYAEAGTYLVSCTVTDNEGVSTTYWQYCEAQLIPTSVVAPAWTIYR